MCALRASPAIPAIPGLREAGYLTSSTALERREAPRELVAIGASAVGLELGQLFLRLGTRVTFLEKADRVPAIEEPEASESIRAVLEEEGGVVVTGARITSVAARDGRRWVTYVAGGAEHTVAADHVLVATGRHPNTAGIGLDRAGIEVTELGAVRVDQTLQTANPRVWAAGDVTGHPQFVYVAAYEGGLAARNAVTGSRLEVDLRALPRVIFTSPAVARRRTDRRAGGPAEDRLLVPGAADVGRAPSAGQPRHQGPLQDRGGDRDRPDPGRHRDGRGSRRPDPAGRLRGALRPHRRPGGQDLGALPHPRRGVQAGGPDVHARRQPAQLLRGLTPMGESLAERIQEACFRQLVRTGSPVRPEDLASDLDQPVDEIARGVAELDGRGRTHLEDQGRVIGGAGLSIEPDRHRVEIDGRTFWTWCGWDVVGIFGALHARGEAHSTSPASGAALEVRFERGRPLASSVVVFRPDEAALSSCDNVYEEWCPNSNFIADREAARAWSIGQGLDGRVLRLDEASELATSH
jgi:hypothetical protein